MNSSIKARWTQPGARRKKTGYLVRHAQLYFMILPALTYILLFHYGPMYGVTNAACCLWLLVFQFPLLWR